MRRGVNEVASEQPKHQTFAQKNIEGYYNGRNPNITDVEMWRLQRKENQKRSKKRKKRKTTSVGQSERLREGPVPADDLLKKVRKLGAVV